jgi:hypothetical protein
MKDYKKPPIYQFSKILVTRIYMPKLKFHSNTRSLKEDT